MRPVLIGFGTIAMVAIVGILVAVRSLAPLTHGLSAEMFAGDSPTGAAKLLPAAKQGSEKPNVVVILADDLGYGDVGVQGGRAIKTPNMDRMAAGGVRFSQFYASAPVCSPSRAGLLTGRYPLRAGVVTPMQMAGDTLLRKASYRLGIMFSHFASVDMLGGGNPVRGLPPSEITIAELLKQAGYRTMAIGKWHLGDFTEWPEYHPHNHGFDEFVGFNGSNDDFPVAFWRNNEQVLADIGADQAKYTGLFTDEALRFIEESKDGPFFLYLAHKDPHLPFFPSEAFAGKSQGGPYGDAVSEFDWSVGRVIATLERLGLAEDTLLIVTSDNGPWFDGSPGGLRGRKGQSYEGGYRVPFVAEWPGHIGPGRVIDAPAMNIDLLPTFAHLAGISLPSDRAIDGADLSPLLLGEDSRLQERALYFFHDYDVEAIRRGQWKYFRSTSHWVWPIPLDKPDSFFGATAGARDYTPANSDVAIPTLGTWPLLYNLGQDPDEAYNVVKTFPQVGKRLGDELDSWRSSFYANPRGWK